MQRYMHRFVAPAAAVSMSDAPMTATLLHRCCFSGIAGLDAAGGAVSSSTASRSETIPQRNGVPWPNPAATPQTPCTDALPHSKLHSQGFTAAACHLTRLSGHLSRVTAPEPPSSIIGQGYAASRAFATEAPQTQAERFDIIQQESGAVRIEGYTDTGFLVNDVTVNGSLLCLRDLWTRWDVSSLEAVNAESIAMVFLLRPFPELLILGTGAQIGIPSMAVQQALREQGIGLEVADTANAVATFNILTQEGRHVVAALLPMRAPRIDAAD